MLCTHKISFETPVIVAAARYDEAGEESSALFETDVLLEKGGRVLQSVSGYAWALACDHVEVVHCQGSHMNLMTPEDNGGDLERTIAPHLAAELARVWGDVGVLHDARAPAPVGEGTTPVTAGNAGGCYAGSTPGGRPGYVGGGDGGGEGTHVDAEAAGRWTCQVWNEAHNLPMWTRPGVLVEGSPPGDASASLRLPVLDDCVGGAVLGLNERAWSLAGVGDANDLDTGPCSCDEATSVASRVAAAAPDVSRYTPPSPPIPSMSCGYFPSSPVPPPPEPRSRAVVVLVQDLMERVSEWSAVALTAGAPVIGVHLPSAGLRPRRDHRRGGGGGEGRDAEERGGAIAGGGGPTSPLERGDSAMWAEEAAGHHQNQHAVGRSGDVAAVDGEEAEEEEEDARAAAVVVAAARTVLRLGDRSSSTRVKLVFAALPGSGAARVAFHAALQCQLCDVADACSVVAVPRGRCGDCGDATAFNVDATPAAAAFTRWVDALNPASLDPAYQALAAKLAETEVPGGWRAFRSLLPAALVRGQVEDDERTGADGSRVGVVGGGETRGAGLEVSGVHLHYGNYDDQRLRQRPLDVVGAVRPAALTRREWDVELNDALARVEALMEAAAASLDARLISAHVAVM